MSNYKKVKFPSQKRAFFVAKYLAKKGYFSMWERKEPFSIYTSANYGEIIDIPEGEDVSWYAEERFISNE